MQHPLHVPFRLKFAFQFSFVSVPALIRKLNQKHRELCDNSFRNFRDRQGGYNIREDTVGYPMFIIRKAQSKYNKV